MTRYWRVVHYNPARSSPWDVGGELEIKALWQGEGRFDIPSHAWTLYLAESAACAVGETFARHATWTEEMLISGVTGLPRALVEYEADPQALGVVELDDSSFLASRNYRPSDIVARNRTRTQEIALEMFLDGLRALRWWSYHRPEWRAVSVWADVAEPRPWDGFVTPVDVQELHIDHPSLQVAAAALPRERVTA